MKKITFLMLHLNYGGIERQVTTLANNLLNDYDIEIISLYDLLNGKSFYNLDERINLKFVFPYGPNKLELANALKRFKIITLFKELVKSFKIIYMKYFGLKKVIDKLDCDVLISSRIEFANQIHRKDITTISQEHSYIDNDKYMKKCKKAFKNIQYLVVMTNKAKELYEDCFKGCNDYTKVVAIPNMINENTSGEVSSLNNNQIISIGRLEDVKDFKSLVQVFNILAKNNDKVTLKIIGEGSKRRELEELIKSLNLQNKVILTGRLNEKEINNELLKSDVFVLTSKSESFSLVLCEAMSYGLPCIAFDVDVGPREIITDNKTGFLVQNRNIEDMASKIKELLNNNELRYNMCKEAYDKVNRYYPKNIVDNWKEIID